MSWWPEIKVRLRTDNEREARSAVRSVLVVLTFFAFALPALTLWERPTVWSATV